VRSSATDAAGLLDNASGRYEKRDARTIRFEAKIKTDSVARVQYRVRRRGRRLCLNPRAKGVHYALVWGVGLLTGTSRSISSVYIAVIR